MLGVLLVVLVGCHGQGNDYELLGLSDGSSSGLSGDGTQDTPGREAKLRDALDALKQASAAEAKAAAHEKQLGAQKLEQAKEASEDAASFAMKADRLLNSEQALKRQQVVFHRRVLI